MTATTAATPATTCSAGTCSGRALKPGTRDCVVLTGALPDPYTGRTIAFVRGQDTSADVQIDHVVALSDAWQKGAQQLERRAPAERLRQRPAQPAGRRRADQPAEGRRRRRDLAAAEQGLPVHLRRPPGRGEGDLRAVGDRGRARRHRERAAAPAPPARRHRRPPPRPRRPSPLRRRPPLRRTAPPAVAPPPQIRPIVHPGAFCAPAGATGVTNKGTPMVCRTSPTDSRNRWRSPA